MLAVITGERGTGKTGQAVAWLLEDPERRRLVVPDHPARLAAMRELHARLQPSARPASFWAALVLVPDEIEYLTRGHSGLEIWVDDAGEVLAAALGLARRGSRLAGMTLEGGPHRPPPEPPAIASYMPARLGGL